MKSVIWPSARFASGTAIGTAIYHLAVNGSSPETWYRTVFSFFLLFIAGVCWFGLKRAFGPQGAQRS